MPTIFIQRYPSNVGRLIWKWTNFFKNTGKKLKQQCHNQRTILFSPRKGGVGSIDCNNFNPFYEPSLPMINDNLFRVFSVIYYFASICVTVKRWLSFVYPYKQYIFFKLLQYQNKRIANWTISSIIWYNK